MNQLKAYADLYNLSEDERLDVIGKTAMAKPTELIGVVVDSGKADIYISKLRAHFPTVHVVDRGNGPVHGTVLIRIKGEL